MGCLRRSPLLYRIVLSIMQLHLVFVGKTNFQEMDKGIQRYLDRLRHYARIEIHLVKAEKISSKIPETLVCEREGERILNLLNAQDYLVVWDIGGKQLDSNGFARFLEKLQNGGVASVWMVIGGPVGVSPEVLKRADCVLSLSRMTFPHDMARLMIAEQLYRAFTIIKGGPYHK
ncbi:23S rRNA (pseudouridine(1915)-N(3))-methyltransferase RlmH [Desulforhabdus amnigena]|uniref:Ribosomal RNA large subunit methyltransferase H n=1 Tax=Desulforhabdus amnigena TaxID=40218 RepID=A0A9W6CZM8_9BACT|nr:23S rRNA (pseudouridine(1915)-N(3))-methyltransferase RlmH [Desulforhabdus amnigena]GLI33105.1 23S rRNA (pseudouridine(1915)-N(3))-methyltransferase RlmH [Desulforhabdus amnigena]